MAHAVFSECPGCALPCAQLFMAERGSSSCSLPHLQRIADGVRLLSFRAGAEAISGAEVVHVPRIQAPTPSKLVFTEDGALYPDALPEKRVLMSAQKVPQPPSLLPTRRAAPPLPPFPPCHPLSPASRLLLSPCPIPTLLPLSSDSSLSSLFFLQMRELSGNATNIFSGEELEHCVAEDPASSPDASSPSMARPP